MSDADNGQLMETLFFQEKDKADWLTEELFEQLFNEYWEKIFGFCQRYVQDAECCREIVQEIFLSLWERRSVISINVNIGHYLFSAARFKIAKHYRNQATLKKNHSKLSYSHFEELTNNTEESILFGDLNFHLQNLVSNLSERCREVYVMSRDMGLPIREIASQLGLSEKTVEAHLTKALKFLRAEVQSLQA